MIIQSAEIKKFRGFKDVSFDLGTQLTIIAGQNGTQKTTILGLLSQPFTITNSTNPMKEEKPLSGGSFKSAFSEKFKLSKEFDKPKSHEWTLNLYGQAPFVLESLARSKDANEIRFWRKGNREKGSGYIQLPVIFLSLQRLIPIGEDQELIASTIQALTPEDITFFKKWHKKILISMEDITDAQYLESPNKNTLGIDTASYDWPLNSAGQDNIGKILLAILSFARLQKKYPSDYKGGILAIDELDATLYPGSQIQLIKALRTFASNYKIQIIFSTHSLSLLKFTFDLQRETAAVAATSKQIRIIYLEKINGLIKVIDNINFDSIIHKLNVTITEEQIAKINAFTEDKECMIFVKAILKSRSLKLNFINFTMGCSNLAELGRTKIPSFCFPEAIVFVDGDIRGKSSLLKTVEKLPNFIALPGNASPEALIANFLYNLPDDSPIWSTFSENFTKQYCFKDISIFEIESDRIKSKIWFNSHLNTWGSNAVKVINPWIKANLESVKSFIDQFTSVYNKFAEALFLKPLPTS